MHCGSFGHDPTDLHQFVGVLSAQAPDLVLMEMGANDVKRTVGHWLRFYQSLIEGIKHVPLVTKQNVLIRMPNGIWVNYVKNKMQTRGKSLKAHDRLQSHSFPRFFWTIRNLYATQCNTLCQHQNHSSPTPRSGLHREVVDGDP